LLEQGAEGRLTLHTERLSNPEAFEALNPEWQALDASLSPRTPFTGPLWNELWWKHLRADKPLGKDELFLHTVRDSNRKLVAVAPMVITRRPAVGPVAVRVAQFFGADPNLTEMRGVVCRPEDEAQVVRALADHLLALAPEWDWVQWAGVRRGGDAEGVLTHEYGATWGVEVPNYYVRLAPTWEEFKSRLPRNIKESLRKCYNSLRRDGHRFTFRVIERLEECPVLLDRFFDLHSARSSMTSSVHHCDAFATPSSRAFLADYARRAADLGSLRIFQIEIGGKVIAARVGFLLGEELYLYYSGYEPAWGRYSVMTTVLAESVQWAIDRGLKIVNLSYGKDISKTRWRPTELVLRHGVSLSPSPRGKLAFEAYQAVVRGSRRGAELGQRLMRGGL
jgi:CelD/BcsL family acetyltransferase involved in cellulose biosynthesis